jgi:hypothetical protein
MKTATSLTYGIPPIARTFDRSTPDSLRDGYGADMREHRFIIY